MQRSFSQSCLWAICLSILCTPILLAQSKQTPAQRWEYKNIHSCSITVDKELQGLGDEGWELVTTVRQSDNNCATFYFKRPKPADAPKYVEPQIQSPPPSKSAAPTCNLPLAQAPTIRGMRLGMTLEELGELFPGASLNELKLAVEKSAGYADFGQRGWGFSGDQHKDRLENIGFYVTLFDGRVRSYKVEYKYNNYTSYGRLLSNEQMIDKLIENFKLPAKEYWKSEHQGAVWLNCQGFNLEFQAGMSSFISVQDTSPSYAEKIQQRQEEFSAKKKAEFKP